MKVVVTDPSLLLKSHVKGHTKKGGVFVHDYERGGHQKVTAPQYGFNHGHGSQKPHGWQGGLFGGGSHAKAPPPKPKAYHPRKKDDGQAVGIYSPHQQTEPDTWVDEDAIATFVPGGAVPDELNGVKFEPWADVPNTLEDWDYVDGQMDDLVEPPMQVKPGLKPASGCIIEEADGRVWLVSPTNRFGGYKNTFPKGKEEDEMSWQANAIKEVYEESGLKVAIIGFLGDVERSTSVTRYYRAVRVGGSPADVGWESQAVHLVPKADLALHLDSQADRDVLRLL